MSVNINADTTNGLVLTSDTSGEINLQAGGATITSITANGMAVDTNTLYVDATNNRVGIGTSSPTESLSVFRSVASQTEGINIRNTTSGYGSRLTFETTRSDNNSVQDMAAIQVYATSGYTDAASSDAIMTFETQDNGTTAERMRIDSSGSLLINTTTATGSGKIVYRHDSNGMVTDCTTTEARNAISFQNPNGQIGRIQVNVTTTSYITSSDYRVKENVAPMSGSIDRLKQLKPSTWTWTQDGSHGEGFLAHEAQTVVPESVAGTKDEVDDEGNPVYQGIDQSKLVPLLTAALQEAITKIEDLETRIQALENA